MVILLVWQQLASVLSVVAVMDPLVAVAVVASLPLVEDKMWGGPALAYHTSADRNKCC